MLISPHGFVTFYLKDSLKKEELMKQELQMRLAVADFMRETLQSMAQRKRNDTSSKDMAMEAKEVGRICHITVTHLRSLISWSKQNKDLRCPKKSCYELLDYLKTN